MLNVKANKKFSMNLTVEDAKKIKSTKEKWCCDYKGCNAAFGDLFDSDSNQLLAS